MTNAATVLRELEKHGLLLKQDKRLPSLVGIVTGESLSTSWWSHPEARAIFVILRELSDHGDVLSAKLLSGKDTLIHRSLWPALVTVVSARRDWQTRDLPAAARRVALQLEAGAEEVPASAEAAKAIQARLLAFAEEVHTSTGRHELRFSSWARWAKKMGIRKERSLARSISTIERAVSAYGAESGSLPWNKGFDVG